MSTERLSLGITPVESPSRKSRLETYLYDEYDDVPLALARDLQREDKPLCSSGVLIPVAAHQESGRIAHSMSEYAAQEGAEPFSVVLLLNYPRAIGGDSITESVDEIKQAIAYHPNLDIRYMIQDYEEPVIGQIRKDLWDATTYVALRDGLYDTPTGEFLGVNHDIDTDHIGRHYMRNVQKFYADKQQQYEAWGIPEAPTPVHATQVKHAYPFDTHPNVARATLWSDFKFRQYARNGCYEEGMVIPLSYYARHEGFDPKAKTYETRQLTKHLQRVDGIPGTPMDTSPRRFIERFGKTGYDQLWTDESFTATDACREGIATPDITHDELESHIFTTFERDLDFFCARIPKNELQKLIYRRVDHGSRGLSKEELYTEIEHLVRPCLGLASTVLDRVIRSPTLASLASDETTIAQHTTAYVDSVTHEIKATLL